MECRNLSKPYHGQNRMITKYDFPPVMIKDSEVMWLEKVTIMQTYLIDPFSYWVNNYFITK